MAEDNENKETGNKSREWEDLTGGLFRNQYHKQGDRQPSMRGVVVAGGVKYHAVAWTRFNSVTGEKYLSLALEDYAKWEADREAAKAKRAKASAEAADTEVVDDDENLPF